MTPVIRIDNEVMDELKKRAITLGLVFEPPNTTLRRILGLDGKVLTEPERNSVEICVNKIHSARKWALIPVPKEKRNFFPGYKVYFEMITDVGVVRTHVTSADAKGTPIGDPKAGKFIQTLLRSWHDRHPELKDGSKLRIEALEAKKRYKLSIVQAQNQPRVIVP